VVRLWLLVTDYWRGGSAGSAASDGHFCGQREMRGRPRTANPDVNAMLLDGDLVEIVLLDEIDDRPEDRERISGLWLV
jgi:hypothetical protein